ncbi:MAG: energy transducer TonB [Ignavibacteriaceae bacterium]|nr:energy transducer TonB [Ignavibacteriaceae bacterium]
MKCLIILICLIIFAGCSSIQQTTITQAPVLLIQHPFPSVPPTLSRPDQLIEANIYLNKDGSVFDVILKKGSGIKAWDSIAVKTIRTWEYSPMLVDNKPVVCWVHQKIKVRIAEPVLYSLSALLFPSYEIADSFYNTLLGGNKFDEVANSISKVPKLGKYIDIGEVDIYQYAEPIRNRISDLDKGEFTKPIKFDNNYIIFKRL